MEARSPATPESAERIRRELEALADPAYRDFQAKLVPTVAPSPGGSSASARTASARISARRPTRPTMR